MPDRVTERVTDSATMTSTGSAVADVERQLTTALAAWGAGSVLVGGLLWASDGGDRRVAFGRQTAAWGAIDLAIAGLGLVRARRRHGDPDDAERRRLRRALVINSVLDVGYVATGVALMTHADRIAVSFPARRSGRRYRADELRGDGAAVITQGAFLLLLDTTFAIRLRA